MTNTDRPPGLGDTDNLSVPLLHNEDPAAPAVFPSFSWLWALAILFVLTILMFGDILLSGGDRILSSPHTDIASQFLYWRDFGFQELRNGNLALWNPHLFSGAPFFGGFQSALLYPLNLPYLFLPVGAAINIGITLHVLLLGFFMYLWARRRGLHPLAALLSGILIMFCGPYFLHIYAGHLPNLCTMTWVPLILFAVDGLLEKPLLGWLLLGSLAFAMQILAGHPQYVYYTGITIMIYITVHFILLSIDNFRNNTSKASNGSFAVKLILSPFLEGKRSLIAIITLIIAGVALSAVQILPGIDAARESIRSGGVSYSFAAMFSFPPENFLTLITPYFFGDLSNTPYWGRAYLWEMNLFIGINGFFLAIYGLLKGGKSARCLGISTIILLMLALGANTPLFRIFYEYFPGYDRFRGTSKFIFFAALCLICLSGMGLDALLKKDTHCVGPEGKAPGEEKRSLSKLLISDDKFYLVILIITLFATGSALYLKLATDGILPLTPWRQFLQWLAGTNESYLNAGLYVHDMFIGNTAVLAGIQLFIAALILLITAGLSRVSGKWSRTAAYVIFIIAILEVLIFTRISLTSFDPGIIRHQPLAQFLSSIKGDARILNLWQPNSALSSRTHDIWGYDPGVPRRYAELITFTQGIDPRHASQYVDFRHYHPLMKMLRLRYVIVPVKEKLEIRELPATMNRLQLINHWQIASAAEEILAAMEKPGFDPENSVILEKTPPLSGDSCPTPGSVRILSSSTDEMTIEAKLTCPAILLITDNYSPGWQVEPIENRSPNHYEIIRANYTLMGIPLTKGNHLFKIAYKPKSFRTGVVISLIACLLFTAFLCYYIRCKLYG